MICAYFYGDSAGIHGIKENLDNGTKHGVKTVVDCLSDCAKKAPSQYHDSLCKTQLSSPEKSG